MLFNYLGAYDNGVTYAVNDAVTFDGSAYVLTSYIGAAGYDPVSYPGSWTLVVSKGDQGPQGIQGPTGNDGAPGTGTGFRGAWDYYQSYAPMDVVVYSCFAWMCTTAHQFGNPPGMDANWVQITSAATGETGPQGIQGERRPPAKPGRRGSRASQGPKARRVRKASPASPVVLLVRKVRKVIPALPVLPVRRRRRSTTRAILRTRSSCRTRTTSSTRLALAATEE